MVAFLLAFAVAGAPTPVTLIFGANHYFESDAYTSAEYLRLGGDGRYTVVDVQHMFTEQWDAGRWRVEGSRIVLTSDRRVRDIRVGDFSVYVFDRCGQAALPELRAKLQALRDRGTPIAPGTLDNLRVSRPAGPLDPRPFGRCGPALGYSSYDDGDQPVPAKRLDAVIAAIDAWLAEADSQNLFEYGVWEYRGERFLVPMRPGMHAVQSTEAEIRERMDRDEGGRAPYVYYAIPASTFERRAGCTYAFKFYPQMNSACNGP